MKITIQGHAEFCIPLTVEQVEVLIECSKHHYDATCREASGSQGYISKWLRLVTPRGDDPGWVVRASSSELDLACKILEDAHYLRSEIQAKVGEELQSVFTRCILLYNNVLYDRWKSFIDTDLPPDPS